MQQGTLNVCICSEVIRLVRDTQPLDRLASAHYSTLLAIAHRERYRLGDAVTMDTRALVHEAFLRLVCQRQTTWDDRPQFLAAAAATIRRVLIDHVRRRRAEKRGDGRAPITLDERIAAVDLRDEMLLALDDALVELARHSPRLARVVECRYFADMTEQQTASTLGVNERTVRRDWIKARGWLQCVLTDPAGDE